MIKCIARVKSTAAIDQRKEASMTRVTSASTFFPIHFFMDSTAVTSRDKSFSISTL